MVKERISFVASALFTVLLLGGVFFITCDKLPFNFRILLGSGYGLALAIYAIALAFALVDTTLRYFYLFADRGTALQPRMSRRRAWILLGAVLIGFWALHWSAYLCR
ncbi:hypothetical protein WJ16_10765 [Burkholderia metallica]|nr:hypothetical protein WJ16_10765 [Burkholderia metallica]